MNSTNAATLLNAWRECVRQNSSHPAVIEAAKGRVISRGELDALSDAWVNTHAPDQTLARRRVAFSEPNGVAWLSLFLGLLKTGAVAVPLDFSEPATIQRELGRTARASFLWHESRLAPLADVRPARDQPDICLVKLTSGSTGTPRALAFTHQEMLADGHQICATMDLRPADLNLTVIPLGHSYGLGNLIVPLLAQGTALLCVSAPLPHAIAADAARWHPTFFPAVPALLRVLAQSDVSSEALQSLRVVVSAGAPLAPEVAQAFAQRFGHRVHSFYGSSETGGIAYDRDGEATASGRSVGRPLDGVTLRFDRRQRFVVESAAVFTQGNRRRSASELGAHRTADRALLNEHGELALLGRAGRMLKIAGRRLDLSEFEQTLKRLPGVRDAFAAPHPHTPEELAAVLATDLSLADARLLLRRELAAWKVPRRILVMKDLPLTGRGKINARALKQTLGATPPT